MRETWWITAKAKPWLRRMAPQAPFAIGLALALLVALLSPLASPHPDGLERVAEDQGFIDHARDPWYGEMHFAVIPDYVFPGIDNKAVATMVAGVVGTVVLFVAMIGLGRLVTRRGTPS